MLAVRECQTRLTSNAAPCSMTPPSTEGSRDRRSNVGFERRARCPSIGFRRPRATLDRLGLVRRVVSPILAGDRSPGRGDGTRPGRIDHRQHRSARPPRAAENGYAVRSADCDGADAYNPLLLSLLEPGTGELASGFACLIASGLALPSGADAVSPFEAAQPVSARSLEVLAPVASGTGIDREAPSRRSLARSIKQPYANDERGRATRAGR
jgi:hypothetical protein